jgi:hypothetical protein
VHKKHNRRTRLLAAAALSALCVTAAPFPAAAADGLAGGVHYASDLDWFSADNGWGPVERDFNNGARAVPDPDRSALSIRGTVYDKGLGTHAPSKVVYDLGGECRQLLGYVGIDDSQGGKGRADFVVDVDGEERFRQERTGTDPAGRVNIDLRDAQRVELRAEPGPEGNGNDHADWADLRINCAEDFLAQPLALTPRDVDLSLLAPGAPVSIAVEGVSPLVPVTLSFGGDEIVANADEEGRAVLTFVVPADTEPGEYRISACGEAPFGVRAEGAIEARVVGVSDRTYFVDCSAPVAGDGSEGAPFATIEDLSSVGAFSPGESILFRRGTECTGTFAPTGSGLDTAPIVVGAYGEGEERPTINGAGGLAGLRFTNVSNWTVAGLRVTNPGTPDVRRTGILYEITDGSVRSGVVVTDNHVEDVAAWSDKRTNTQAYVQSAGIVVRGDGVGAFRGVTVTDNVVNDTGAGGIKLSAPDSTKQYNTDVYVARNSLSDIGGDGIVIHNSDAPLIEHNSALNLGHGKYPFAGGNFAGMWPYNSVDPLFQFNVVGNSVTSSYDSTAWDCDMKIKGSCVFQYNYSYGNAGGFYLDCVSGCGTASTETTVILRYNVAQDDCRLAGSSGGPGLHLIYNNTFSCISRPFEDLMSAPREVRNNIIIAPGGELRTTDAVYSHNAYYGGIQPPSGEENAITDDPMLVAAGSGQQTRELPGYRLAVGSPLIGAGAPIEGAGDQDFFGNPIPGGAPNVGAYQGEGVDAGALPFADLVNQTSVANLGNPRNGAITSDYRAFSEEALAEAGLRTGETVEAFGTELDWHPNEVGTPDTVKSSGQRVALEGDGDALVVAGFSTGAVGSGTATVHYQDGTNEEVVLELPSWSETSVDDQDTVLLAQTEWHLRRSAPYLNGTVTQVAEPSSVFAQRIPLSGKPVESVTLPQGSPMVDEGLSLLAVSLTAQASQVDVAVTPRCLAGKAYLYTSVRNTGEAAVDIAVETPFGAKGHDGLAPGKVAAAAFNSTATDIPAGEALVTVTGEDGRSSTRTAGFAALACG